jgi:hypothetical protein
VDLIRCPNPERPTVMRGAREISIDFPLRDGLEFAQSLPLLVKTTRSGAPHFHYSLFSLGWPRVRSVSPTSRKNSEKWGTPFSSFFLFSRRCVARNARSLAAQPRLAQNDKETASRPKFSLSLTILPSAGKLPHSPENASGQLQQAVRACQPSRICNSVFDIDGYDRATGLVHAGLLAGDN